MKAQHTSYQSVLRFAEFLKQNSKLKPSTQSGYVWAVGNFGTFVGKDPAEVVSASVILGFIENQNAKSRSARKQASSALDWFFNHFLKRGYSLSRQSMVWWPCLDRFREFVELRDLAPKTRSDYVRHVRQLGEFAKRDPESLSEAQVRDYFLFLRKERKFAPASMNQAKVALRHFYTEFSEKGKTWTLFEEVRIRRGQSLPNVLSREEVAVLLDAVEERRFRMALRLTYHCGLRISETLKLEVADIFKSPSLCIHIRKGKGNKNRYVPLGESMYQEMRRWWTFHRNPRFLFPTPGRSYNKLVGKMTLSQAMHASRSPMSPSPVQTAFKVALAGARIKKQATPHTLRHSYATHMIEEGVSIRLLQQYMGHESLEHTAVYLHLTSVSEAKTKEALEGIYLGSK